MEICNLWTFLVILCEKNPHYFDIKALLALLAVNAWKTNPSKETLKTLVSKVWGVISQTKNLYFYSTFVTSLFITVLNITFDVQLISFSLLGGNLPLASSRPVLWCWESKAPSHCSPETWAQPGSSCPQRDVLSPDTAVSKLRSPVP